MSKSLARAQALQTNGYLPVPIGAGVKYPVQDGRAMVDWPNFKLTPFTAKHFTDGIGIICGDVAGVDVDCLDEALSKAFEEAVHFLHGWSPVRIGQYPKRLLVYRAAEPFSKKKVVLRNGDREVALEILGKGQQFVAYGVHPGTGKPYYWVGRDDHDRKQHPGVIPLADLPAITEADASFLLEEFARLGATMGYDKVSESRGRARDDDDFDWVRRPTTFTDEQIDDVLSRLPGAAEYSAWLECGMGLHNHYGGSVEGFERWDKWSQQAPNYSPEALETRWGGFGGGAMTFATMVYRAGGLKPKAAEQAPEPAGDKMALLHDIEQWQDRHTLFSEFLPRLRELPEHEVMPTLQEMASHVKALGGAKPPQAELQKLANKERKARTQEGTVEEDDAPPTLASFVKLMKQHRMSMRYNCCSKEIEFELPGVDFGKHNTVNVAIAYLLSICAGAGFPKTNVEQYMVAVADHYSYHPVCDWVESKPWDGVSRWAEFKETLAVAPEAAELRDILLRRWLVSAIAAAFTPGGISAHGMLVLQGGQGLGKTHWFKRLVPDGSRFAKDGMLLSPDNKDSVLNCVAHWLVELGEIDATFDKASISHLKAFLTAQSDRLRVSYARAFSSFPRQTVFFGSVNALTFLNDDTGNRRFWTIPCLAVDRLHGVDMQQMWAEVLTWFHAGEQWVLSQEEQVMLNQSNKLFESVEPIAEMLDDRFDWDAPVEQWLWRTLTSIAQCVLRDPSKRQVGIVKNHISPRQNVRMKTVRGKDLWLSPPLYEEKL